VRPVSPAPENPWIADACREHGVARNRLDARLQEQYGQFAEDLVLESLLRSHFERRDRPLASIRYLEIGANHPIQTSNTFLFHRKWGGSGVLVEANPALIETLRQVRSRDRVVHRAVVPAGFPSQVELSIARHAELSSVDGAHLASIGRFGDVVAVATVPTATLDELLAADFRTGLDLLSIDIEGLDLQVLRDATLPVRPAFVVAEPSRWHRADAELALADAMRAHGYDELARTEHNLIYADRTAAGAPARGVPRAAPGRRASRPVPLFDELIARRCGTRAELFAAIERASAIAGFARAREDAERALDTPGATLLDAYDRVARSLGLAADATEALLALEVQTDLAQAIPVADKVARLDAESVLLADGGYPPDLAALFVARTGIARDLPIVTAQDGAGDPASSSDAGTAVAIGTAAADAAAAGVRSTLPARAGTPTPAESRLRAEGFEHLSRCLRTVRLVTRAADLPPWLARLQFELALPALVAFASAVRAHAKSRAIPRVLFAARACLPLKQVFDATAAACGPDGPTSVYWHTSRITRSAGQSTYLDYCRRVFAPGALVVELSGSGASMARLAADLGPNAVVPPMLLCQRAGDEEHRRTRRAAYGAAHEGDAPPPAIAPAPGILGEESLELLNLVPQGMVVRVERVGDGFAPVRDTLEFDLPRKALLEALHAVRTKAARHLGDEFEPVVHDEVLAGLPRLLHTLGELATELAPELERLRGEFGSGYRSFEWVTRHRLAARAR